MILNLDHLVSWVDQLSLDWDIFEWVVIEMIGVFSSDLVGWDRSIPLVDQFDRFGGCGDLTHPALSSTPPRRGLIRCADNIERSYILQKSHPTYQKKYGNYYIILYNPKTYCII
jgi:hypothetical protein